VVVADDGRRNRGGGLYHCGCARVPGTNGTKRGHQCYEMSCSPPSISPSCYGSPLMIHLRLQHGPSLLVHDIKISKGLNKTRICVVETKDEGAYKDGLGIFR
jgi:hypothetical protein